jgi:hypothetical protein
VKTFSVPPSVNPFQLAVLGLSAWAALLGSCSQAPVTVNLHSLQASGRVSFVCRGDDNAPSGHKLDECPDYEHATRRLLGLVTQTATDEIAVIDLTAGSVVDTDPSTPGYSFLRVGARPEAIVSTPGGAATFVGVTGPRKNGIFALPTTCLAAPKPSGPAPDLTTWSACSLSSPPGEIAVLIDPERADSSVRASCAGGVESEPPQGDRQCPANLTAETGPPGRRKLLVSLPDEHRLVLLDAQSLLDRSPGKFEACSEEASVALDATQPGTSASPELPVDLQTGSVANPNLCPVTAYPPLAATASPTPGGFALSGGRLYVADRSLPAVHVLDVTDPCAATELPPLLPRSYLSPTRVVTTSRVAVSPLTPSGKQFVYAVDETDQPTASVMVFDVSPKATNRTPLIFPGAPRQPYLPPDRLRFSAPVRDVSFVMRDFPALDASGVGQFERCDPYPSTDPNAPGAQYRPNGDDSSGAGPRNLRGVFAFAMLTNGQIAVIDVEDFDAPCRRPITGNTTPFEDFRGCVSDKPDPNQPGSDLYFTESGVPTVTDESSCNVIEPHRPRAAWLSVSSPTNGLRAPTLRAFPQFSNPDPSAQIAVRDLPHMLAADFDNPDPSSTTSIPAQVNVSAQVYANCPTDPATGQQTCPSGALPLNPISATPQDVLGGVTNSLTLPLVEPRSYAADESPALTFEGRVFPDRSSAFLELNADPAQPTAKVHDPDASFCSAGVEDSDAIASEAASLAIPAANRAAWAAAHADYLQITGDFPGVDDVYWRLGQGKYCAGLLKSADPTAELGGDRDACDAQFGNIDNLAVLKETRDLSITAAYSDHLEVKPRYCASDSDCALTLRQLACCFPAGTAYTVRASHQWLLSSAAGLHDIGAAADGRCVHTASCDPRKKYFRSRAFEVCDASNTTVDSDGPCSSDNPKVGCVSSAADFPVEPGKVGRQCIFENLTSRFVVYRGAQASTRGMAFSWQTTGGFTPLSLVLATQSSAVNPQSMSYLPELGFLGVVDGSTLGLSLFDLNSLGVVAPSPYF